MQNAVCASLFSFPSFYWLFFRKNGGLPTCREYVVAMRRTSARLVDALRAVLEGIVPVVSVSSCSCSSTSRCKTVLKGELTV